MASADSRQRTWCLPIALIVALVAAGCASIAGLGQPSSWTFAADNGTGRTNGIDYVIRSTVGDKAVYQLLSKGTGGVVTSGVGSPDPRAAIAILDPVTCRVVSMVSPVPPGNNRIDLTSGWLYPVEQYDPADFLDDESRPERGLPVTEACASSDPAATPRPDPTMAVGTWLHGWEMDCEAADGGPNVFSVRGESLDGATAGCEAHLGDTGQGPIGIKDGISIWNPGGDERLLGIGWEDTACADSATVSLLPTIDGYRAHVISIGSTCAPGPQPHSVIFHLTDPLDAALIRGEVERIIQ